MTPEATVKSLQVADGLEVTLFAAEPMLLKPADIDVDAMGRVWVCEGVDYRAWANLRKEGDRIVILEDTHGNGRADKQTVFYQGTELACPLGICVLGNRVIVSNAPSVYSFIGDNGKAVKKELVFTGIDGVQHDHSIHAFIFGPDGRLYFNFGNAGAQLKHPDGSPVVDIFGNTVAGGRRGSKAGAPDKIAYRQGMVFRMNPDGSELEVLANNFRNNYEVTIDSFGTLWQSDNDDDGNNGVRINYVMEYGNFGYQDEQTGAGWQSKRTNMEKEIPLRHWHQNDPGVVPNLLNTGAGSPAGICIYEGNLLPKVFRNQIIHCDPGPQVVRSYPVQRSGAGYSATIVNMLRGTTQSWFRPSDVCVAPDGSLIVADWCDPQVGGHGMQDNKYPNMHGRIYRIAPPGTPYKIPPLDLNTPEGAVDALMSPNMARRYLGWTALHEMGEKAEPALLTLWKNDDPRMRARALWLLARLSGKGEQYVQAAIDDKNPDIRITGLRAARELKMEVIEMVERLAHDQSPAVRRECAIALHYNKSPQLPELWAQLAEQYDGKDRWYLEALGIGAADRDAECLDIWLRKIADWNTTAGRDIIWRSRAPAAASYLGKVILDPATGDQERPRFVRALDFIPDGEAKTNTLLAMLDSTLPDKSVQFEGLIRLKGQTSRIPAATIERVLDARKGTTDFVELCEQLDVKDRDAELLEYAAAHADSVGATAARLVVKNHDTALLEQALAGPDGVKLMPVLGSIADGSATGLLAKAATAKDSPIMARQAAVKAMARTLTGAVALLDMAKNKTLPADLFYTAGNELRMVPNKPIHDQAMALFSPQAGKDSKPLPPVGELIKMRADAKRGRVVYAANCAKCHQVGGEGVDFGPNLSEIGTKLGKEALVESILQPSAAISFGYEGKTIKLKDGNQADGIIASQTADEVTLKTSSGASAIVTKYKRSDIAEIKDMKISIMPEGLQTNMTTQDFVDLIEYLSTLKKK